MTRAIAYIQPLPYTEQHIINVAEQFSEDAVRQLDHSPELCSISFDAVYDEVIYPNYGIQLREDMDLGYHNGQKVYGRYNPSTNVAFIDKSLQKDWRRAFTCWHEVGGHGVLQGDWLRQENRRLRTNYETITTEYTIDSKTENLLERQANLFASRAAAPTFLIYHALDYLMQLDRPILFRGPGEYCLLFRNRKFFCKANTINDICRVLAKQIQWRFGSLSVEALSYRIEDLGIFTTGNDTNFTLFRKSKEKFSILQKAC